MNRATAMLDAWNRVVEAGPGERLVVEGMTGVGTDRAGLEAIRRRWLDRLPADLTPGQAVVFQRANGSAWLGLALALWSRGAVIVPLDPLTREAERARLTEALRPAAVIVDERLERCARPRRWRAPVVLGKVTSGTTGLPRVLFFTAAELAADAHQVEAGMGIGSGDVNLAAIPFGHSYGLGNLVLPALLEGRPVVCASGVFPRVLVTEAARGGATVFPATPPLLQGLLRGGMTGSDWPALRLVISAGAPLDPTLAEAFRHAFGRPIHNFYGSTESGGIAFDRTGELGREGRSVGLPLPGVRIGTGPRGRLVVASAAVYSYRNRRRWGAHPATLLNDRGVVEASGAVVLAGRVERFLKIGARRVDPREIEDVLQSAPGVSDCVVDLVPAAADGEPRLAALVAGTIERKALRAHARERLAAWKVPKRLRLVADLPVTVRGKLDRAAVRRLLGDAD